MTEPPRSAWVPSGIDPTDLDYPLPGSTPRGCLGKLGNWLMILLALYGLFALYQSSTAGQTTPAQAAIEDVLSTDTPQPTPTVTLAVTLPPLPGGATLDPPPPTATLIPTNTPLPQGLATWTPGPWMATRFAVTREAILRGDR